MRISKRLRLISSFLALTTLTAGPALAQVCCKCTRCPLISGYCVCTAKSGGESSVIKLLKSIKIENAKAKSVKV